MRTTDVVQPLIASLLKSTFNLPSHSYPQKSEFHFRFHTHRPVPGLPRSKHHKLLQPVVVSFLDFPFLPDYLWSRVQFISSIDENFTAKNVLLPLFSSLSPLSSLLFSSRLSLPPRPLLSLYTHIHNFTLKPDLDCPKSFDFSTLLQQFSREEWHLFFWPSFKVKIRGLTKIYIYIFILDGWPTTIASPIRNSRRDIFNIYYFCSRTSTSFNLLFHRQLENVWMGVKVSWGNV